MFIPSILVSFVSGLDVWVVVEFLGCKDIHDFVNIQGVLATCSSLGYDFVFVVISFSFLA